MIWAYGCVDYKIFITYYNSHFICVQTSDTSHQRGVTFIVDVFCEKLNELNDDNQFKTVLERVFIYIQKVPKDLNVTKDYNYK